jgi:curved DNA-binding protein CbpA
MAEEPLPDYYAILQVHPSAEPEIIEAAYRRLMLKYHPDKLPEDQRQDLDVLARVRAINLAYDVLSDPQQRAAYDEACLKSAQQAYESLPGEIEIRVVKVRCARSRQTFKMMLGKKNGVDRLFRVIGFEEDQSIASKPVQQLLPQSEVLSLPQPKDEQGFFARIANSLRKPQNPPAAQNNAPPPRFPDILAIKEMFSGPTRGVGFNQIDFSGWSCPACHGQFTHPDGTLATWCRCSACKRIYCAGDIKPVGKALRTHCPWCGRRANITAIIRPGEGSDLPVNGETSAPEKYSSKTRRLEDKGKPKLPG